MSQPPDFEEVATQLLGRYSIAESDTERLRTFGEAIADQLGAVVDDFYDWLPELPEFAQFFTTMESTQHLRSLQQTYWTEFFQARVDGRYVEGRRRVGHVHATIGLSLHAYFAAMNRMFILLSERAERIQGADAGPTIGVMGKLILLDMSLVSDAFAALTNKTIAEQSEAIMAMSTPVAEVASGILMLPLVGVIDSVRAQDVMSAMLTRIRDTEAKVFILDISGVAVVDTAVANHLIKMTQAAQLMGCECIVSGLSPAIAKTIVALNIDVSRMDTRATLKDAIATAFSRIGVRLSATGTAGP